MSYDSSVACILPLFLAVAVSAAGASPVQLPGADDDDDATEQAFVKMIREEGPPKARPALQEAKKNPNAVLFQDPAGTWRGKIVSDLWVFALQLKIEADGSGWKGQVIFSEQGGDTVSSLRNLSLNDNKVFIETELTGLDVRLKGKLAEGRMSGTAEVSEHGRKVRGLIEWDVIRSTGIVQRPRTAPGGGEEALDEKLIRALPRPTGPSAVGRASMYWKDSARPEAMADDPRAKRELMVDIWYPAQPEEGRSPAPYVAEAEAIAKAGADSSLPLARSLRTNAVLDAPFAAAPRRSPVLIFSHGMGVKNAYYSALLEELASHGYVVAAIQHTYETSAVVFPDGRLVRFADDKWKVGEEGPEEKRLRYYKERLDVWAADAIFVLNQLVKLDAGTPGSALKGRLDFTRVGIFGHSFGGLSSAQACRRDDRFKACINMDGMRLGLVYLPDEVGHGPRQPFLYVGRRRILTDSDLAIMGMTRKQYGELERKRLHRLFAPWKEFPSQPSVALLENTRHMSFSDEPLFAPKSVPRPLEARLQTMQLIRDLTRSFFDHHVRGDANTASWPTERPGVLIELLVSGL